MGNSPQCRELLGEFAPPLRSRLEFGSGVFDRSLVLDRRHAGRDRFAPDRTVAMFAPGQKVFRRAFDIGHSVAGPDALGLDLDGRGEPMASHGATTRITEICSAARSRDLPRGRLSIYFLQTAVAPLRRRIGAKGCGMSTRKYEKFPAEFRDEMVQRAIRYQAEHNVSRFAACNAAAKHQKCKGRAVFNWLKAYKAAKASEFILMKPLAAELNVTSRTLRFYEDVGLGASPAEARRSLGS